VPDLVDCNLWHSHLNGSDLSEQSDGAYCFEKTLLDVGVNHDADDLSQFRNIEHDHRTLSSANVGSAV
jgi:hypothetical protein